MNNDSPFIYRHRRGLIRDGIKSDDADTIYHRRRINLSLNRKDWIWHESSSKDFAITLRVMIALAPSDWKIDSYGVQIKYSLLTIFSSARFL